LIADDTDFHRASLKDMLLRAGLDVIGEAVNGAEALTLARSLKPDIVILDIVMPEKSGLQVAAELKGMPFKIIMCSTLSSPEVIKEAMSIGASAYIVKPLSEEEVIEALRSVME
jgi:two-component system chemotaxis response regulator CheY